MKTMKCTFKETKMGHYRSEMMSAYEIAYESWKRARLQTMRKALETKPAGELPLGLIGPALRILGQMTGSPYG